MPSSIFFLPSFFLFFCSRSAREETGEETGGETGGETGEETREETGEAIEEGK